MWPFWQFGFEILKGTIEGCFFLLNLNLLLLIDIGKVKNLFGITVKVVNLIAPCTVHKDIQTCSNDYKRLLNKPYENEVTFIG